MLHADIIKQLYKPLSGTKPTYKGVRITWCGYADLCLFVVVEILNHYNGGLAYRANSVHDEFLCQPLRSQLRTFTLLF